MFKIGKAHEGLDDGDERNRATAAFRQKENHINHFPASLNHRKTSWVSDPGNIILAEKLRKLATQ